MRAVTIALAVLSATATTWAAPSWACSFAGDDTYGSVTFYQQTVPSNADLWITTVDEVISYDVEVFLIDPAGTEIAARLERDGVNARVVSDVVGGALGLAPGAWIFRARSVGEGGEPYDADYVFEVADVEDTTPPAAPTVTIEAVDVGGTPDFLRGFLDDCGPYERQTIRVITINVTDVEDTVRLSIDGVSFNASGGYVSVANRKEDGSDVVVSAFDFAGNESEVVVATAVRSDGCAAAPAAPISLLASVLLFMRRRRRVLSRGAL